MQEFGTAVPGISLSKKWGQMRIFHATIVALGEPKYIRFLFNPDKNRLAVQTCDKKVAESFCVPRGTPENWDYKLYSQPMLQMIWNGCGWENDKSYRVSGIPVAEQNLVEFDLSQANIIETDLFEH